MHVLFIHRPIDSYIRFLAPLFEVDFMLPRTLMSVMSPKHIPKMCGVLNMPPEVILAVLYYYIHNIQWSSNYGFSLADIQKVHIQFTDCKIYIYK